MTMLISQREPPKGIYKVVCLFVKGNRLTGNRYLKKIPPLTLLQLPPPWSPIFYARLTFYACLTLSHLSWDITEQTTT